MLSLSTFHRLAAGTAAAALLAAAAGAQDKSVLVLGGGSTFAAPLYKAWIEAYEAAAPTVDIGYDVIGSGEGIDQFLTGSLDFAATDAPLTTEQEAEIEGGVIHVPVTAGMVAIAYNLPGDLEGELRLPRDVLGDIFAGAITSWDDPRIVSANPGLELPHQTLYVVARLDGSGTTYAFTNHLDATSDTWRHDGHGVATRVAWPNRAMLARGNEGVAGKVQRADGAIGYVEYGIARQAGLPLAALQNAAGAFVAPSPESRAAAIPTATIPEDMKINIPDPSGEGAYPVVTFTWELLRNAPRDESKAQAIEAFTKWVITEGQDLAPGLGYVPMPQAVRDRAGLAMSAAFQERPGAPPVGHLQGRASSFTSSS